MSRQGGRRALGWETRGAARKVVRLGSILSFRWIAQAVVGVSFVLAIHSRIRNCGLINDFQLKFMS